MVRVSNLPSSESIAALRLEDIVLSPNETISRVLEFLDFPRNPLIDDFVAKHEPNYRVLSGRNYNTSKISLDYIQKIQTTCKNIFESLGYSFIDQSDKYYSFKKLPILSKSHNETWTL